MYLRRQCNPLKQIQCKLGLYTAIEGEVLYRLIYFKKGKLPIKMLK